MFPRLIAFLSAILFFGVFAIPASSARHRPVRQDTQAKNPWDSLPFTAREWARQAQLPYRRIPLKKGGTMSVQEAYDLYLQAGQPDYPDMDTPGLVTDKEIEEQIKLSRKYNAR